MADLNISIGANLSSYNASLQQAETSFNTFAKSFSSARQPKLELNLKTYLADLQTSQEEFDKTRLYIEQTAISMGIDTTALKADLDNVAREVEATNKKIALSGDDRQKKEEIARHSLETQKKYALKELATKEEIARHSLELQKKYALEEQANTEEISRHSLETQKKYALKEQATQEEIARHSLALQKKYALETQAKKEEIARHSLETQKKYALKNTAELLEAIRKAEQRGTTGLSASRLATLKTYSNEELKETLTQAQKIKSIGIRSKHETYRRIFKIKQLTDGKEILSEFKKLKLMSHAELREYEKVEVKKTAFYKKEAAKRSIDSAVGRGILDSVKVVAKYGAISQALYGIQQAFRSVVVEALRFNQSIADVGAVLDKSRADSYAIASEITRLSVRYGEAASSIHEATLTLGRAGVDNTNDLIDALKQLTALSIITGDSIADGAAAMASLIAVYKDTISVVTDLNGAQTTQIETVTTLTNSMAAVANATRLGLQDFSTISNYALTSAKSIGLSADAFFALSGAMSKVGLNASTIGTSIRRLGKLVSDTSSSAQGFFLNIGYSQEQFAKDLQDDSIKAIESLGKAMSTLDITSLRQAMPNQIQLKATLTTLKEIYDTKGIEAMTEAMRGFLGVEQQADKAALGIGRALKSVGNAIQEMYNKEVDKIFYKLFDGVSVGSFQKAVSEWIERFKTIVAVLTEVVAGIVAFKAITLTVSGAVVAWTAIVGFARAATVGWNGALLLSRVALNKITTTLGKMSKANIAIGLLSAAYVAWRFIIDDTSSSLDDLYEITHKTNAELDKMSKVQARANIAEARKLSLALAREQLKLEEDFNKKTKTRIYLNAQLKADDQAIFDAATQNNKDKQKDLDDVIAKYKLVVDGKKQDVKTAEEVSEASLKIAKALEKAKLQAIELTAALKDAARTLESSLRDIDVFFGKLSATDAQMQTFGGAINDNLETQVALEKALVTDRKNYTDLLAKNKGDANTSGLVELNNKLIKQETKLLEIKNNIATNIKGALDAGYEEDVRQINIAKNNAKALATMQSANKQITDQKELTKENKRLAEEKYAIDVKSLQNTIAITNDTVKKKNLQTQLNTLTAQHAKAAQAAKVASADSGSTSKVVSDLLKRMGLEKELAELAIAEYERDIAKEGRLLTEVELNAQLLKTAQLEYKLKAKAHADAVKDAKSKGLTGDVAVQKKILKLKIDMINADKSWWKEQNKQALKFEALMRGAGSSFADSLLEGNIAGAFQDLAKDIYKVFTEPMKESFSELFGDKMTDLIGGFYDTVTEFIQTWATEGFAAAMTVAQGNAVAGIAAQGQGDPYSAWARMAAMAATMAAMGLVTSFSGGGQVSQAEIDAAKGRTEFDDESLTNLSAMFEEAQYPLLKVTETMSKHIRNMDNNFYSIAKAFSQEASAGGIDISGANFVDTMDSGFLGFSSKSISLIGTGLQFAAQNLGQMMDETALSVQAYTTVLVKKSKWWGLSQSESIRELYKTLPQGIIDDMADNFAHGYETVMTAGVSLGLNEADLARALEAATIDLGKLDFTGLSPAEINERLSLAFSEGFSGAVEQIPALTNLVNRYSQGAEESLETLGRLAVEYDQASYMFGLIGKNLRNVGTYGTALDVMTSRLAGTFGDSAERIARASLNVSGIMYDSQMLISAYTTQMQLLDVVAASGGLESFTDSMNSLMSGFYTDTEQMEFLNKSLKDSFDSFGVVMPETNAGFRELLEGFEILNETDAETYAGLLSLAEGFAELNPLIEGLAETTLNTAELYTQLIGNVTSLTSREIALTGDDNAVAQYAITASEMMLEATKAQTELYDVTMDTYFDQLEAAHLANKLTSEQLANWSELGNALMSVEEATKSYNDLLIAQAKEREEALAALAKERADALAALAKESADALAKEKEEAMKIAEETMKIATDMVSKIADAWVGELSYLTLQEKAAYAAGYADIAGGRGDILDPVAAAKLAAKTALKTTTTKEDYIPVFERYINELDKAVPDATLDDVVTRLDDLIVSVKDLEDTTIRTA